MARPARLRSHWRRGQVSITSAGSCMTGSSMRWASRAMTIIVVIGAAYLFALCVIAVLHA